MHIKFIFYFLYTLSSLTFCSLSIYSQVFSDQEKFFGSNNNYRWWYDVKYYDLTVEPDFNSKTIKGFVDITYSALEPDIPMHIDLTEGMEITRVSQVGSPKLVLKREGAFYFISNLNTRQESENNLYTIHIEFKGTPKEAIQPPWDGGAVWTKDSLGRNWFSVACQGIGASSWFPCKDYAGDEPEMGMRLTMIVPKDMEAIAGGKLIESVEVSPEKKKVTWDVQSAINIYNIIPYIGYYKSYSYKYSGKVGELNVSNYALDYNLEKAKMQFEQVKPMLSCFEEWFGPYPFYNDGYKIVEAPYLGMEHQSAIAYGNGFENGYNGRDLSGTGIGLLWDFIIIHESGHEWFGNNISVQDVADMWVHEAFTNYAETIYTECQQGREAADKYVYGIRKNVKNDIPIVGVYEVHNEGSGDMYYKGGNLIHMIRHYINDDEKFKKMLQDMNSQFYHQTVAGAQIEEFMQTYTEVDLVPIFDAYLREAHLPTLLVKKEGKKVTYKWSELDKDLKMPLETLGGKYINPTGDWQCMKLKKGEMFEIHPDFFINILEDF